MILFDVFWENPAVVGLILAIPTITLGILAYRRSGPLDKATVQVGVDAGHIGLIAALQVDNKIQREQTALLRQGVDLCQARIDILETANDELLAKEHKLELKITVLESRNEELEIDNRALRLRVDELEKGNGPAREENHA